MSEFGFLNVYKPAGITSHDVIAILRKKLNIRRIGHSGTLDPFAEGVLVVAVANATRLLRFLPETKAYEAIVDLTKTTDTDDLTGEVLEISSGECELDFLKDRLSKMTGTFEQIPPLYSAIKVQGKKLYEMMRAGENLSLHDIKPRTVHVNKITILAYKYPFLQLQVSCEAGFYVRSLARDLGGHLQKLIRIESNGLKIEDSHKLDDITVNNFRDYFLSPVSVLELPKIYFNHLEAVGLQQGKFISCNTALKKSSEFIQCIEDSGEYLGIAKLSREDSGTLLVKPQVIV